MVHKSLVSAGLVLFALLLPETGKAQITVFAGANFGNLSDINPDDDRTVFDTAIGYHAGFTYDLSLPLITVRPGVFYRKFGDIDFDEGGPDLDLGDADLSFIDVPVDILLKIGATPVVKPYLLGGTVFSFAKNSNDAYDGVFEDVSISVAVGIGARIGLLGLSLTPELRYEFGVSDLVKDKIDFDGVPGIVTNTDPPASFAVRIGIEL